jgi:AraC-like DNA-binding protein
LIFELDTRRSDSPFVEQIWHARSVSSGMLNSISTNRWEMVVSRVDGETFFTIRGPHTKPESLLLFPGGDWVGIRFKIGTFMPQFSPGSLLNSDPTLPNAGDRSFWLDSAAWQFPDFENADTFVARLVNNGLIARDPVVDGVMRGEVTELSPRSIQRRFLQTTGLTQSTIHQIERARSAMAALQQGVPILDVVHAAGYYDQPHLTRALKRWLGETPVELAGSSRFDQVSV